MLEYLVVGSGEDRPADRPNRSPHLIAHHGSFGYDDRRHRAKDSLRAIVQKNRNSAQLLKAINHHVQPLFPDFPYQSGFQYHIFPHRLYFGLIAFATQQKELDHATIRPKLQHLASGPRDDARRRAPPQRLIRTPSLTRSCRRHNDNYERLELASRQALPPQR